MASRFGTQPAQPAYMRMGSSNSLTSPVNTPNTAVTFGAYGPHTPARKSSGGPVAGNSNSRRLDRKDTKEIAGVHWRALRDYLAQWGTEGGWWSGDVLTAESPTARASAREKLTRLMRLQFLELSTDVYDELMRRLAVENPLPDGQSGWKPRCRLTAAPCPFLPVREDFHPKRNQARQKLATLPQHRFKDLASDVFFELRRRYPEFDEDAARIDHSQKSYDEPLTAPGSSPITFNQGPPAPVTRSASGDSRPTHNRQGSSMGSSADRSATMGKQNGSRDRLNLTMPTNDMVVPNKSRLQEEAIQVPYARDTHFDAGVVSDHDEHPMPGGPNGLRDRPDSRSSEHGPSTTTSHDPNANDEQYIDRMSFASTAKSKGQGGGGWEEQEDQLRAGYELRIVGLERRLQRAESERDELQRTLGEEQEQRKDYEDEVRGLKERAQTHASSLRSIQHELEVARDGAEAARSQNGQSSRQAQEEIAQWRERCEGLQDVLRRVEEERADRATSRGAGGADDGAVSELQNEVRSLVEELKAVSLRNDELESERDFERESSASLASKVDEYRRQASALRTELRNLKATSMLFIAKPLTDDHMPASPDGNIADVHVSEFQSAIDTLLGAARSTQPTGVLAAMKAVVEASSRIGEDVEKFEQSPNLDVDASRLESLKHESTVRLAALMTAARNHAMASGLSPVSLIDAAAGHLSANVVEIIKLLKIRRSGSTRDILRKRSSMSIGDMVRRRSGPIHEEDEGEGLGLGPGQQQGQLGLGQNHPSPNLGHFEPPEFRIKSFQSASSTAQRSDSFDLERNASVASTIKSEYDPFSRTPASPESRGGTTPVPTVNVSSVSSVSTASHPSASDKEWLELKVGDIRYTDSLTPAVSRRTVVRARQLDPVHPGGYPHWRARTGAERAPERDYRREQFNRRRVAWRAAPAVEVSGSTSDIPPNPRPSGDPLLADMVGNTDRLSEAQQAAGRAGGFDKALREGIARASFGVAKALKELMRLGSD